MAKFTIREARRDDCEDILRLVKELANFENLPDGPKINADGSGSFQPPTGSSKNDPECISGHNANAERLFLLITTQWTDDRSRLNLESVKVLQRDGFDTPHPYFKCFVAELNPSECKNDNTLLENGAAGGEEKPGTGRLVGYALYFFTYSTWNGPSLYLEDIYVTSDCRSTGIGSALFDRVAQEAFEKGCCRLDFVVLNWNPATDFYKHKGAVDLTTAEGWHHYRLETEALKHLALLKNKNTTASP